MTNQGPKWIAVRIGADTGAWLAERQDDGTYQTAAHFTVRPTAVEMAAAANDREDLRAVTTDG